MLNLRRTWPMHIWIMDEGRDTARANCAVTEFLSSHFLLDNYASVSLQAVATLVRVLLCSPCCLLSLLSLSLGPLLVVGSLG